MPELTIILPCRNEEKALDSCLKEIKSTISRNNLDAEIIVSDSSIDSSPVIARRHKVKLIKHNKEGYGIAYLEAFKQSKGKYVFMADCDGTYDFKEIPKFLKFLRKGYDLVIGDRFKGKMDPDSMPPLHRYVGNPVLSGLFRMFFRSRVNDVHCGMRAINKESLDKLNLRTTGMEFASEMVIKAVKNSMKIKEIPINYHSRQGESKLRSLSDGWRHLRFMLLYSPIFLFLIPGLILFLLGISSIFWLYFGNPSILGLKLFYHPMFLSALLIISGYQLIIFSVFAKAYAINHLGERSDQFENLCRHITIERASILGLIMAISGIIIYLSVFFKWIGSGFGAIQEIKNSILALTFIILGIQTIFSSFMLSILAIKEK